MGREERRQWAIALGLAAALVALLQLPYALGYALARPGTRATGVIMNPEDSNSYLAKMQQGYAGQWLYEIPYTAEPHAPAFLGGFYILLGHAARVLKLSVLLLWHLARGVSALLMFLVTFGFIKHFLREPRAVWLAYAGALVGSGLGWVLFLFGQTDWLGAFPTDFKMPEAHLFFTALTFPHFAVGAALIVTSLWLSLRAYERGAFRFAIAAGVINLALGIVYPFLIYLIAAVLSLYWLAVCLESRRIRFRLGLVTALALAVPAPLYLYYFNVWRTSPVFAAWDAQSVTPSPHPLHYVVAYGVMLALAAPTLRQREWRFLWLWLLAVALLVYAPLNPQRRFVEAVQVPLAILAAAGLTTYYLPRLRVTRAFQRLAARPNYSVAGLERLIVVMLMAVLALSNLYVLASTSVTAAVEQPDPLFRTAAEVRAVEWAGANLPRGAVLLAAYETGNFIPARTMLRVMIGHWAETMDWERKMAQVEMYWAASTAETWRSDFLAQARVDYVFYGPRERLVGAYDPSRSPQLVPLYENESIVIFQVKR